MKVFILNLKSAQALATNSVKTACDILEVGHIDIQFLGGNKFENNSYICIKEIKICDYETIYFNLDRDPGPRSRSIGTELCSSKQREDIQVDCQI
jgi:hypothetical protein